MAQQLIDIGTADNTGNGDPLRTSLTKANDNFTELYDDKLEWASVPSSATDTGILGQISYDADYIYICTATDTWKRVAITTW